MKNQADIAELEKKIGYRFQDRQLLTTAVTHTSFANEHRKEGIRHNERLEFLGDAVLELVSSEFLYKKYPDKEEGELSKLRASMVCEPSLAKCARDFSLQSYLRLGNGEEGMGGRGKDSIISDALESVIGAIYLDGGFAPASEFVRTHVMLELRTEDLFTDSKTALQELVQMQGGKVRYEVLGESGPDHNKSFTIGVYVNETLTASGTGRTKKAAAQKGAHEAIQKLRKENT